MLYVAYGSNLHPLRLERRIPAAKCVGTAALDDYALRFHKRSLDGSGKCSIAPGGERVHVAVYEIDTAGLRRLDRIEGVGTGYERLTVDVPGFGACMSYTAGAGYVDDRLQPYDWYREMVIRGCRYHGCPGSYIERIAAVAALPDPDERRSAANWEIVNGLSFGR